MPIVFQKRIYRSDLERNPYVHYLFGDNEARSGYGGQAKACRGAPNAIGIATKVKPARTSDAYWSDDDFKRCKAIIDTDFHPVFDLVISGKTVVVPSDGLGTGLSELPKRAPKLHALIQAKIKLLSEV